MNGVAESSEKRVIQQLVTWLENAGWPIASVPRIDRASQARHDAVIDTGHGLVLIDAKRREKDEPARISIEAYPAGYRIFLAQQPNGNWRFRTESNTYDPRPFNADNAKQVLLEMLGQA